MEKADIAALSKILREMEGCIVGCSGGVDSMLLSAIAHRKLGQDCHIAHTVGPSVPEEATQRVKLFSEKEGWQLHLLSAKEFSDETYLANPKNRCFYCKNHLYDSLTELSYGISKREQKQFTIVSGTNTDDLREYRPGLDAARDFGVRHPYVEAGINKNNIREMAHELGLPFSELPASPCLSSRLYTGTRVTPDRLQAVHFSEKFLQTIVQLKTVRCRLQHDDMLVEVPSSDRPKLTSEIMNRLRTEVQSAYPLIRSIVLDPDEYKPGRAFQDVS